VAARMTEALALPEPVRQALAEGRPVVALETSVLAQGLPPPRNLEAAERMDAAIRAGEAVPAWVWVSGGAVRIGATLDELRALAEDPSTAKAARRDLPVLVAKGRPGATTVSATVWAAHTAGIAVATTGGIGGVHPGSGDVSADLLELARTPITLVCSGPKSILDPAATLERIDELGLAVIGYRCDRLPFFVTLEAPYPLEHRADAPVEVARAARAAGDLGIRSALLVCNPVPEDAALDAEEVAAAVASCRREAEADGVLGKALTPHLLACLGKTTGGRSVDANVALLESNARLAGQIATVMLPS
jgi:pseudouridine-5'-phosphate glycosidase